MDIPKKYHVQLKDSERKISETWREIRSKSEFYDVTLACDESQLNAHKVILSSFSPVLQNILTSNYHQHPLIYLRGISYPILSNIIEYIYKGEVSISQETIKEFLSVANELKIKGLSELDRQESVSVNISEPDFFANYIENVNSNNPLAVEYNQKVVDTDNHESLKPGSNEDNVTEQLQKLVQTEDHNLIPLDKDANRSFVIKTEVEHENILSNKEDQGLLLYYCKECDHKTNYKSNLTKHVKMQHEGVQYACETCHYSFKTQTVLKHHVDSKHLGVQYSCNQCDHSSTDKGNLKKHIASQHEGVRHSCDKCGQSYAQKYHLMEHIKSKHEGFRYNCKHCNNNYIEKGNLKKHIASQHKDVNTVENDEKIISCDKCSKQFLFLAELVQHNNAVHEEIGNHLKAHIEEKQKDVNTAENNGKMISCDKCGKQFLLLAELAKHNRVVHDEIRYPCDQCKFRSASKSNLRKHIASKHEGIRYYCDHCDHKSTQRGHLKAHIELKHKEIL